MKTQFETKDNVLLTTRVFDAPQKLVFETFSDCKHLMNWWGPRAWPLNYCKMDFRVGGTWHYCMKGPNPGDEAWGKVIYKEIKAPDRMVYEDYFSDKDGNINKSLPGGLVTYDFSESGGKTTVKSSVTYATADDLQKVLDMGMVEGMNETLDRLDELLAEITVAR